MSIRGVVRIWHDDEGWGVVDSPETPGGCWVHFSDVAVGGFASLERGCEVELEWEAGEHDGFPFHATRTWPVGQQPVEPAPQPMPNEAYRSGIG